MVVREKGSDRVFEATAGRGDLLLRLNDCKVTKENVERELSEQNVIVKSITVSLKHQQKKLNSLDNAKAW